MQQPAPSQPSPDTPSFAGLLAALATPPADAADRYWSNAEPTEEVATLSYERALRTHVRYRMADRGNAAVPKAGGTTTSEALGGLKTESAEAVSALAPVAGKAIHIEPRRDLRPASVTVRLSKGECAQLRQRADEAGLTVSAYLRSCTFEVDALRAQVKAALEEMKAAKKGSEGAREQGSSGVEQRGIDGVRLARVLVRVGRLCVGLCLRKTA